jgi:TatD DNase family protein
MKSRPERLIELNFILGIGGVVTFKNSGFGQGGAGSWTFHLVLETDAPYLAPVPYRGKQNEPAYTRLVAEKLADLAARSWQKLQKLPRPTQKSCLG